MALNGKPQVGIFPHKRQNFPVTCIRQSLVHPSPVFFYPREKPGWQIQLCTLDRLWGDLEGETEAAPGFLYPSSFLLQQVISSWEGRPSSALHCHPPASWALRVTVAVKATGSDSLNPWITASRVAFPAFQFARQPRQFQHTLKECLRSSSFPRAQELITSEASPEAEPRTSSCRLPAIT